MSESYTYLLVTQTQKKYIVEQKSRQLPKNINIYFCSSLAKSLYYPQSVAYRDFEV